jgi:hypothetical protein
MHTKNQYRFETEADAIKFADAEKVSYDPSCDVYVTGPFFIDEAVVLKDLPIDKFDTYREVGVEVYK